MAFLSLVKADCCGNCGLGQCSILCCKVGEFCCANRKCNWLCCNCPGGSCWHMPECREGGRRDKRTLQLKHQDEEESYYTIDPMEKFVEVDQDSDGFISKQEATNFLVRTNPAFLNITDPSWFDDMDVDGDGRIRPNEFDRDLE